MLLATAGSMLPFDAAYLLSLSRLCSLPHFFLRSSYLIAPVASKECIDAYADIEGSIKVGVLLRFSAFAI